MKSKKLMAIIEKYTDLKLNGDKNLFGVLYPVDIFCIIKDIEKEFSITINPEFILADRKLNIEMLDSIVNGSNSYPR